MAAVRVSAEVLAWESAWVWSSLSPSPLRLAWASAHRIARSISHRC